jgi:hypothetical protein
MHKPLTILISLIALNVHSQIEKISPFGDQEKEDVLKIAQSFLGTINGEKSIDYKAFLTKKRNQYSGRNMDAEF